MPNTLAASLNGFSPLFYFRVYKLFPMQLGLQLLFCALKRSTTREPPGGRAGEILRDPSRIASN